MNGKRGRERQSKAGHGIGGVQRTSQTTSNRSRKMGSEKGN